MCGKMRIQTSEEGSEGRGGKEEGRVFRVSAEINMQRVEEGEGRGGRGEKSRKEKRMEGELGKQ